VDDEAVAAVELPEVPELEAATLVVDEDAVDVSEEAADFGVEL
jgi:hypothetical protein